MATLVKTPAGSWKAVIRKTGWPMSIKTFRIKRDAEDCARRTEDEMVRGAYIRRSGSERTTIDAALRRYLAEVTPGKRPVTQVSEVRRADVLIKLLGRYSLAALTPEIVARFRDERLAGDIDKWRYRQVWSTSAAQQQHCALGVGAARAHVHRGAEGVGLGASFQPCAGHPSSTSRRRP